MRAVLIVVGLLGIVTGVPPVTTAAELPWIKVASDQRGFVTETGKPFVPWGVNYDHDDSGRLLEDYWVDDWERVAEDFAEMRDLGFNIVRVHLQFGKFMNSATEANPDSLRQWRRLLDLAEREGLYLDVTGLGCYHKADVPAWYDALEEAGRWSAQAHFWKAVATGSQHSSAVFCYDLMNEPVVPGGQRASGDWLGPPFAGKHFVQMITLDPAERSRPEIARQWIQSLVQAIREVDRRHLITVGLVDWSLDRPGLTSGFVPQQVTEELDFVAVHLYPRSGQLDEALETLKQFQIGKPLIIEETFPLGCQLDEMATFLDRAREPAAGVISFYWGRTPAELEMSGKLVDGVVRAWLLRFPELKWPSNEGS